MTYQSQEQTGINIFPIPQIIVTDSISTQARAKLNFQYGERSCFPTVHTTKCTLFIIRINYQTVYHHECVQSVLSADGEGSFIYLSRLVGKPTMWFPNRSDTNWAVQAQKRERSLKFRI